jgi:uncharacterized membrane protein YgcG
MIWAQYLINLKLLNMTYIHDFTGREISHETYLGMPYNEQRQYHLKEKRHDSVASELIDLGIQAAALGIILGDYSSDSNPSDNLTSSGSFDAPSSGFDEGFGGGDYSGGGAGGDF